MAVTSDNPAPYAPASAILEFVDRYRNKGLAKPFTAEVLARAGVSDSLIPRTMQALVALELATEAGEPTETLEGLRRAPENEFKARLAAWLQAVYADAFAFVSATDDETAIRDAFRAYNPVGQQTRMVSLFLGLCRAAGLRNDEQAKPASRPAGRKPHAAAKSASTTFKGVAGSSRATSSPGSAAIHVTGLPAPISGLLSRLPPDGASWTRDERRRFEQAFQAMLDFCYTTSETTEDEEELE